MKLMKTIMCPIQDLPKRVQGRIDSFPAGYGSSWCQYLAKDVVRVTPPAKMDPHIFRDSNLALVGDYPTDVYVEFLPKDTVVAYEVEEEILTWPELESGELFKFDEKTDTYLNVVVENGRAFRSVADLSKTGHNVPWYEDCKGRPITRYKAVPVEES